MTRQILPNRRAAEGIDFEHGGVRLRASVSRFPDGNLGEVFLSLAKPGGALDDMCRDLAVTVSIALQFGAPVDTLRKALTRSPSGGPAGPLSALLDLVTEGDAP